MADIKTKYTYDEVFTNKRNVLFVLAHPDDIIVYYGALINKLVKAKKNIYVVSVTNGARGSQNNDIPEYKLAQIRNKEEIAALEYLQVPAKNYHCLQYKDGEVESNYKLIGKISYFIRKYKADVVCTHEPTMVYSMTYKKDGFFVQHRDHRKVAEAVVDSAYPFSRDRSFFPEHLKEDIQPHTVMDLIFTDEIQCNFDIDYTDEVETKKQALRIHKSQMDEEFINDVVETVKFDGRYLEKYFYVKLLW